MRVLVTIPHFFNPEGNKLYGSTGPDASRRSGALSRSISGLHQTIGPRQAFLYCLHQHIPGSGNGRLLKVNTQASTQLDIAVCTTGEFHLIHQLAGLAGFFHHQPVQADPMMIGFACHQILKANLGKYDYYCYLEDGLLVTDPDFFKKLKWFNSQFGEDAVLFPHRYEISTTQPLHKLYIDGPVRPDFTAQWQDVNDRRHLQAEVMGDSLTFERWTNPHSGCFFLNSRQMEKWVASASFKERDCSFAGPLESAASMGIMKTFRIYKPAPASAGFFEIQHLHNRYLGEALKTS